MYGQALHSSRMKTLNMSPKHCLTDTSLYGICNYPKRVRLAKRNKQSVFHVTCLYIVSMRLNSPDFFITVKCSHVYVSLKNSRPMTAFKKQTFLFSLYVSFPNKWDINYRRQSCFPQTDTHISPSVFAKCVYEMVLMLSTFSEQIFDK